MSELEELRVSLSPAIADIAPLDRTRSLLESSIAWDDGAWKRLSGELALAALGLPETYGGQGFGRAELGIALEELGRVLYSGPFLPSAVLAAGALLLSGDAQACERWLPAIGAGEVVATIAVGPGQSAGVEAVRRTDGTVELRGRVSLVIAGAQADLILIPAACSGEGVLVLVEASAPGLAVEEIPVMDLTRRLANVGLDGVAGTPVRTERPAQAVLSAISALTSAAFACEQAGAARAMLDLTLAYATDRVQFGREIGSFQAVRHRLADLYAEVEIATAAARRAIAAPDLFGRDAQIAALTAQSICSETFLSVAEQGVQLHGGIGFTWEHPAHLYFKRAKSSSLILGGPEAARSRLAPLLADVRQSHAGYGEAS